MTNGKWDAVVGLAFFAMLALIPLYDVATATPPERQVALPQEERWWSYVPPERIGDDFSAIIPTLPDKEGSHRAYRSLSLGLAVRDTAGGEPERLVVPEDLSELHLDPETSEMAAPKIRQGYLRFTTGDHVVTDAYEVGLTPGAMTELGPRLERRPYGVLRYESEEPERDLVLHTDPSAEHVVILPRDVSPTIPER